MSENTNAGETVTGQAGAVSKMQGVEPGDYVQIVAESERRLKAHGAPPPEHMVGRIGQFVRWSSEVPTNVIISVCGEKHNAEIEVPYEWLVPMRKHVLESAGYWFRCAREHQAKEGEMSQALVCMENAYNHLENALAAVKSAVGADNGQQAVDMVTCLFKPSDMPKERAEIVFHGTMWAKLSESYSKEPGKEKKEKQAANFAYWLASLVAIMAELNMATPKDAVEAVKLLFRTWMECNNKLEAIGKMLGHAHGVPIEQRVRDLQAALENMKTVEANKRLLTRELDIALHGEEGAAQQAALCDLIGPAKQLRTDYLALKGFFEANPNHLASQLMAKKQEAPAGIEVTQEPDDIQGPFGLERCFRCAQPTAFWFRPNNVACCQDCAKLMNVADVPSHETWMNDHAHISFPSGLEFFTASGDCVCPKCGKLYREHAHKPGYPWLHELCDGLAVKL